MDRLQSCLNMGSKQGLSLRSLLLLTLKLSLSGLAFFFIVRYVDLDAALRVMVDQHLGLLVLAALLIGLQILFGAARWAVMLRSTGAKAHMLDVGRLYYTSVFFNTCLPGAIGGDVVRVWLARKSLGSFTQVFNSVVLDRVAAFAGLIVLVLVALPFLSERLDLDLSITLPLLAVCIAAGVFILIYVDRLPIRWRNLAPVRLAISLAEAARRAFFNVNTSILVMTAAVAAHLAACLCVYLLARSLEVPLSVVHAILLVPPALLLGSLPISIGGWGVREAVLVALLGLVGIAAEAALVISVQLGVLTICVTLPGGVTWLVKDRGQAAT